MGRAPSSETLQLFKADLWKDQRRLDRCNVNGQECLAKYFENEIDLARERQVIQHLSECSVKARVPELIDVRGCALLCSYVRGIRVFNLLVELSQLGPDLWDTGAAIKEMLLARCEENQREIQAALLSLVSLPGSAPYPAGEKVGRIIRILGDSVGIVLDWSRLQEELKRLDALWKPLATVPFRDATTKNMVLAAPELWLGNFDSEERRRQHMVDSLKRNSAPSWLSAPIVDFDFSSCIDLTTPEDDPISLRFHERTWAGPPAEASSLCWHTQPDGVRAALTFLVRYYRFGGRKAAYRILHPWGHRIRFRHDNDLFYFMRLNSIMRRLWPEVMGEFACVCAFTEALPHALDPDQA